MESDILNKELKATLTEVCGFAKDQKWKLIYKGSTGGFSSAEFHSKCNLIEKTLTIIKSDKNNIFGGYTDKAWSKNGGFIKDDYAFLFNLVNSSLQPIKIKCSDPEHAIFNKSEKGPIFGNNTNHGHDLCIKDSKSYSNLGVSYTVPGLNSAKSNEAILLKSYLAGSYNFEIKGIEVFCKI